MTTPIHKPTVTLRESLGEDDSADSASSPMELVEEDCDEGSMDIIYTRPFTL